MLRKFLLIFVLICSTKCEYSPSSVEKLYAILDQTSEYFKNLSNVYEASNIDVLNIDSLITKYMENTTGAILQRQRRSSQNNLRSSKEINVLRGFEENLSINLPGSKDIAFISVQDELQLLLFAVAIDSSKILLYQLLDNKAHILGSYPQFNGKRIIVNNYNNGMLIVFQRDTDEIIILRLSKNKNGVYELHFKQEFQIPGVRHMNMWSEINQLYLGIASDTEFFIYVWLGEHFDKIDAFHFGARKLLSFRNKSFMHIVVVGSRTKIFRFSVRSNKFVETQKLRASQDASSFYFKEGHFEEHFLVLIHDDSTILYKEMYGRFVPFQKIALTKCIHSLTMDDTVILFSANEDTVEIYQYNGWRFQKLHMMLSNIRQIRQIRLYHEDKLIVQDKDGQWKFLKPIWAVKKTWQFMQNEINAWCSETERKASSRIMKDVSNFKDSVQISNAHIGQLHAQNINGHNAIELIYLTQQYKKTIAKLNLANSTLMHAKNMNKFIVLHGKKIIVKCKEKCHVHRINKVTSADKSKILKNVYQTPEYINFKINTINSWNRCPLPNFDIDDIFVKQSINGILMQNLREDTLKISGDQEVFGKHIFDNLYVTNATIPLDIATRSTQQRMLMEEARVEKLHLTDREFLLPLNGSTTTMNGSITATKVKLTGFVEVIGKLEGKEIKKLMPIKDIYESLILPSDRFLQNVTFRNLVKSNDIISSHGLSLKRTLENSIPLNSNVPKHLILFNDKTQWSNVTLWNYKNWVTKNSVDTVVISGTKFASNDILLTNATYASLSTPKLMIPLCVTEVITQEVRTSLIKIPNLVVKNLNVTHVVGASDLKNVIFDSVSALKSVDFATKLFTGHVTIKNISALKIKRTDIRNLSIQMSKWMDMNRLKGPINISKLVVNNLKMPTTLNFPLPDKIKDVIVKADSNITKINGVNVLSFMQNSLKINDVISFEHVKFTDGVTSNYTHAFRSTLKFSSLDACSNLYSKRISKTLETDEINIPQTFVYIPSDVPPTFIIQGTATFAKEPTVQNIKDINLNKLFEDIWMSNEDTVLFGSDMFIENMTIDADVNIYNPLNFLSISMWLDISDNLLSKTKQQNITVDSSFKNAEISTVITANNSVLQSLDPNLEDLLTNTLMKNKIQTINAIWNFEELNIGHLNKWSGKLNNIDLDTDIVRYDAKQNIITGRKTITNLIIQDLWSYNKNFANLVNNALTKKCQKPVIIKGQKTFNNISLNNLSVKGTIMGQNIKNALLKFGNQTILGIKKIEGHLNLPSLITDSTVNDINPTELINNQVKINKTLQIIKTKIDFKNNLEVFGNITIGEFYKGVVLNNINYHDKLDAIVNRTVKITELAEDIRTALHNPAIYVNKFEIIDENTLEITLEFDTENVTVLNNTCLCDSENVPLHCNDTRLSNILAGSNSSTFMMTKLILLNDTVFVAIVSSNFVSIYTYDTATQQFYHKTGLYVPGILQASVEPVDNSLWIILRLSEQTLILHYQIWDELVQYVLPASNTFVTSRTPNNQTLLIRSDGIWSLGGVFHPEHVFKVHLNGKLKTFAHNADYYVKAITENSTAVLKARYVGD